MHIHLKNGQAEIFKGGHNLITETDNYKSKMIAYVVSLMPERLRSAITNYLKAYVEINEIRIRLNQPIAFTLSGGNLMTGMNVSNDDIQYIVSQMTEGNYFKNDEIMRSGYVSLPYSLRAGICGDVFVSNGAVKVLKSVSSINLRIPSALTANCDLIIDHIKNSGFLSSILVFSPPCCGKTTLLRSISRELASSPYQKRVLVIDTNRELALPFSSDVSSIEYLSGYPKAYGIELATRYMNPEYIICDELGGTDEINAIYEAVHCGVPIIASLHCDTFFTLKHKKNIELLLKNGVFDTLVRIKRQGKTFDYELKKFSEL